MSKDRFETPLAKAMSADQSQQAATTPEADRPSAPVQTRFANMGRASATVVLLSYLGLTAVGVFVSLSASRIDPPRSPLPPGKGDILLYWNEVEHMRGGRSYYQAAQLELTRQGFPTGSVFNWRTPLPMWLLAQLPDPGLGRWIIGSFAVALGVLTFTVSRREMGLGGSLLNVLLTLGAVMPVFDQRCFILPMTWAGVFIGLCLASYGLRRWRAAIVFGVTAAIFRELAAGCLLVLCALSMARRHKQEALGWCLGFAVFAIFYGWHFWQVSGITETTDIVRTEAWIQLGGLPFVLATVQMNSWLLPLPQWLSAIFLPNALLGLIGWKSEWGARFALVTIAYLLLFAVVGQSFNQYWGLLTAPLLPAGFVRVGPAFRDLFRSLRKVSPAPRK